jgi:prephenate dehydrogenase
VRRVYERVALLGTGMVGGSLALAIKAAGAARMVAAWDVRPEAAEAARARGIVDAVLPGAAEAVREAELVVLAAPVGATAGLCEAIAGALDAEAVVTDVGSTKVAVLEAAARWLPRPERFVGGHPIAGTEKSGPDAADAGLFRGRRCLLTPVAATDADALADVRGLWEAVGAVVSTMDAALHDRALAFVSHLPHAAAFALAAACGAAMGEETLGAAMGGLHGGGFVDTTRIAESDPVMWRDVFLGNPEVMRALERMDDELGRLRRAIAAGNGDEIVRLIEDARSGRKRVLGK